MSKEYRSNKSYDSKCAHWLDTLLSFNFEIENLSDTRRDLVDFISRECYQLALNITQYDEQLVVAHLDVMRRAAKRLLIKNLI